MNPRIPALLQLPTGRRRALRSQAHVLLLAVASIAPADRADAQTVRVPIALELSQVTRRSAPVSVPWSAAATRVPVKALQAPGLGGSDHLSGRLPLGKSGIPIVVARSTEGGYFDTLFLDPDGGAVTGEHVLTVEPKISQDGSAKTWFEAPVRIGHGTPEEDAGAESIPLQLYVITDSQEEVPSLIRMRRLDFRAGTADLGEAKSTSVIVRDMNTDGIYDGNDGWELVEDGAKSTRPRKVSEFAWAGGKAWRLELGDRRGRSARIVPHDPGLTEQEDLIKRDIYRRDKLAPRAREPLVFRRDVTEAIADARESGKPYFLKFETDWCGPCKLMSEFVFPSEEVTAAAKDVVCIVVDGDQHKDLVGEHGVKAYPTGILFDGAGEPRDRYVGYRGVTELTVFFLGSAAGNRR